MLKLIYLEWKKNHILGYLWKAAVMVLAICLFFFAFAFLGIARDPDTGIIDVAPGADSIQAPIELFTSIAFLIFTCVMLSSFIVSAYKNKTMNLMFCYPIKRQKILLSQMLAVWIFNFLGLVFAKLLIYGYILGCSHFLVSDFPLDYSMAVPSFYLQLLFRSATTVTTAFIALYVGLCMHSSKAVIVCSFLLVFLLQGTIGDFSFSTLPIFPVIMIGFSLLCILLSLSAVEVRDVN